MITVRKMEQSEAAYVKQMAKKAFVGIERFFVTAPQDAMVAVQDGKIVGSISLITIEADGVKIGYFDTACVDPEHHGAGIGSKLYEETTKYLWDQGCTALSALVKDDNIGSWKLFLNNGFSRVSLVEATRLLGVKAMLRQYFSTPMFISIGMELYVAHKQREVVPKRANTMPQLAMFLAANALLMLPTFIGSSKSLPLFMAAFLALLASGALFGWIGTLFSKRRWNFRLNSGGGVIVAVVNLLGGVLPLIGNWYPQQYENSKAFNREMGVGALCEWVSVMAITALSLAMLPYGQFFTYLANIGMVFLVWRCIPVYPFEPYGGGRVFRWSKGVYITCAVVSALIIAAVAMMI